MKNIVIAILELFLYFLSGFVPKKKNRIIFGSWNGENYSDNSKFMFEFLKDYESYELVWVGKKKLKGKVSVSKRNKFVAYGTIGSYIYAARSKFVFFTHSHNDIVKFNMFRRATIIQLWHGVGIKNLGANNNHSKFRKTLQRILRKQHYFISSSKMNAKRNLEVFLLNGITEENVLRTGQPRNDFIINHNNKDYINVIKNKIFNKLNISNKYKIITYVPTFRANINTPFSFLNLTDNEQKNINTILKKNNFVLLEKAHNQYRKGLGKTCDFKENIYNINDLGDFLDSQELLLITDILITDYSSIYIDFLLLNRPIIHYTYDYDEYINQNQGVYYNFNEIVAGDIVNNFNGLLESIEDNIANNEKNHMKRIGVRKLMLEYENGDSCKKIYDKVILNNELKG